MTTERIEPNTIIEETQEEIFRNLFARLRVILPTIAFAQSDPLYLDRWDIAGYEELRNQYFNARSLGHYVNWAQNEDLDNVLAINGIARKDTEIGNDEILRARGLDEPFSRYATGSELSIISHAKNASSDIVSVFPQRMADDSVNIYIVSTTEPDKIDSNRGTKASDIKSGSPLTTLLTLATGHLAGLGRVPINSQYFAVRPFYKVYSIVGTVKYHSRYTSLEDLKSRVGETINAFVVTRCRPNQTITRSDIVHTIEENEGVVEAVITTPGTTRDITLTQYGNLVFPTHSNPKSGIAAPRPYLPTGATDPQKIEAGRLATAWYCYPDALEDVPTDIKLTYTDIAA